MIPAIQEIGFGPGAAKSYATLHQATVSLQEMGERTISTQVRIDGDVVPDFTGWELVFKGERFILPTTVPQAAKDNSTRNSLVDLNFSSWIISELKRYYFVSLSQIDANTAIADKYKASVILPIRQFVELFNRVLKYYFGDQVRMDLFNAEYSSEPVSVEINYTHIWDVLQKFYELFGVRWNIVVENGAYVIKVGFAADSIEDHDFEYGYQGGLLKFERQVQDENITNILLGRGGEKNLPYRYFKLQDPQNPEWEADPDAIPELANVYFDRLRDAAFRWYVRGWMQNPNRDTSWDATHTFPTYDSVPEEYQYAYDLGRTDAKFNPVEFVKDDASVEKYGGRWGAQDDNDDIYPTIQGVKRDPIGRVDQVVDVSEITTDDTDAAAAEAATVRGVGGTLNITEFFQPNEQKTSVLHSGQFTIPSGSTGNLSFVWMNPISQDGAGIALVNINTSLSSVKAVNVETGVEYEPAPSGGLPAGTYYAEITVVVKNDNTSEGYSNVTYGLTSLNLAVSTLDADSWKPTFDIWVKNIWNTEKAQGESDAAYAARVWEKILGDRVGNEAKVVFSDGFMSISEDYEFQIASYPVFDQSKSITVLEDGEYKTYQSEWKITLRKSDADFDATGKYVPSADGGKPAAGDHFFFTGIDMPFSYVEWAEETLHANKKSALDGLADIQPTWVITLDKVRVHTIEDADYGRALADRLAAGATVWIKDRRFTENSRLKLYVQSITYTWNEPSDGSPYLVPDIEVVLSDKVVDVDGPVAQIQSSVETIRTTYARATDVESIVRRVAEPLFLKKTGEADSSVSPTQFASKVTSKSFRQGDVGGEGWGFYTDTVQKTLRAQAQAQVQTRYTKSNKKLLGASEPEIPEESSSVLELDKLVVRKELRVNSLVANQIAYVGGRQINSAASIECTQVVDSDEGYYCYFNQKRGSVANLFVVGDFAMGQMFDPVNVEVRYYKARVDEVGQNYILLSKTVKDGAGAPEVGDVIVQHGHESNASRQYVIVRDVIGGGYERMLSGLNSVSAAGKEYYFAGRLAGQNPHWFVGDTAGEYAEWINGRLNIKGTLIVRNSDGTYQAMTDYMSSVASAMEALQAQIDGQIQSWSSGEAPSEQTEPFPQVVDDVVDPSTANFPASGWTLSADREKHFGDIYVDDSTGQGYRYTKRLKNGVTEYYWTRITDEEVAEAMRLAQLANQGVAGLQYLKQATNGGTLVSGGLVLTSMIQLGQAAAGGAYNVWAGINGTIDDQLTNPMRSIAAWYGGPMVDYEADPTAASYAKSLFRMDGSGYLASGNIHWDQSGYGGIPGITWNGSDIIIGGNVKLASLTGDSVTELLSLVRELSGLIEKVNIGTPANPVYAVHVKDRMGFYSDSFVDAGGVGSGGGGGGGADLLSVWVSLKNNDDDYANWLINAHHIPIGNGLTIDSETGLINVVATGTVTSVAGVYPVGGDVPLSGLMSALGIANLDNNLATISDCLKSLQSQVDSVASRDMFDELSAASLYADVAVAQSLYADSISLDGNDLSTKLNTLVPKTTTVNGHALSGNISLTKSDVGLGNVENTALSTWSGTGNITTLGTITTGVWNGTPIANDYLANKTIGVGDATITLGSSATLTQIGIPAWAQKASLAFADMPAMYIGNARVQSSAQTAQNIGGLGTITASGLIKTENYIQGVRLILADGVYFEYDSISQGVKLVGAGFWTESYVTAGGVGSGGGGGGDVDLPRVWESLTNNTDFPDTEINPAHIPDMSAIYGYLKGNQQITITGVVTGSGTTSITTSIADGALTISMVNGLQNALNAKQDAIGDLQNIRTQAAHGETAYNSLSTVSEALQSLQSQIDSVASRDCFDELTVSVFHSDMVAVSELYAEAISLNGADLATSLSGLSTAIANEATARANAIAAEATARNTAIANAVNALDSATEAVSSGYFLTGVTITDGKITGRAQANSISGNAATATRLADNNAHYLWGVSYWASGVPQDVTAAPNLYIARTKVSASAANDTLLGVTAISNASSSGSTGDETRIEWDATNHAWHFYGGIYADTFVTAGGVGSGGGGGDMDIDRLWQSLTNNPADAGYENTKIALAHIPDIPWANILSKPTTIAGYGIADAKFGTQGADYVPITLGATTKNVLTAHQSLSGYATETWVGQQGFITKAVNDLTNYYTKTQTYTRAEVNDLIGSINQFHYEIAASTGAVTDPQSNVLYLIGPTGSGSDKYEEYVYTTQWVKIGDTSIDLTPYLTKTLAAQTYQPIISDLATIISNAAHGEAAYNSLTTVSAILQSLQAQVDSVASRDTFDELTATVFYSDVAAVSDLYVGAVSLNGVDLAGSLSSLESRATSLESRATSLEGKFTGDSANSALRLSGTATYSIWGVEYWSSGVPKSVTGRPGLYIGTTQVQTSAASQDLNGIAAINATGLATIAGGIKLTTTKKIYFGDTEHYLELDSNGFHFSHGVYSEDFVTAGGIGSGGGGGSIDIDRLWQSLQNNPADQGYEDALIAPAHIPDMAAIYGYLKGNQTITLTGIVTGSGTTSISTSIADGALSIAKVSGLQAALDSKTGNTGTVTSVGLSVPTGLSVSGSPITTSGTLAITFASGYSIPTSAQQSAWSGKQDAISDLATIRSNAANGATAYSWGNHADEGYLTSANGATISQALQSLQSQVDSVAARDMFDELSATVLNTDTLTATSAYIGTVNGSLSGNATTASYLVSASYGIGGGLNPIYFSGGRPVASTSTAGSASVPVYLNGGTLTAITPSSLFSALSSSAATNLSVTIAGQVRTIADLYARYDKDGGEIAPNMTTIGTALRSLQSQVDSVATRNAFDELTATVLFTDMLSVGGDAMVGGLATIAGGIKLTTTKKIWFDDTHYLELLTENGTQYLHTNLNVVSDAGVVAGASANS